VYCPTDLVTHPLLEDHLCQTVLHEEVSTHVTVEDFQHYWQRVNERISSLYSDLHFGHYKAALFDYHLLVLHAPKNLACAKKGVPLARWG